MSSTSRAMPSTGMGATVEPPPDPVAATALAGPLTTVLLCHYGRTGYNVLRALAAIQARVYAVIDDRSASVGYSRRCTVLHKADAIDRLDPATTAALINDLHRRVGVDSVLACDVESLTLLNRMRPLLRAPVFPSADLATIERLNNKWSFYQLCREIGVTVPQTVYYARPDDLDPDQLAGTTGYPVIVKPVAGYGQRGIVELADRAAALGFARSGSSSGAIVVQEFITGDDWAISVFANEGRIAHWAAWKCPGQLAANFGVGRFLSTEFSAEAPLFEAAAALVAATKFTGIANFDARRDPRTGTFYLFECNPRVFGRLAVARLCGLDFVQAGLPGGRPQPFKLDNMQYYPWQEVFTRRGWRHFIAGRWRPSMLARDVAEMLSDPLPPMLRKLMREDAKP